MARGIHARQRRTRNSRTNLWSTFPYALVAFAISLTTCLLVLGGRAGTSVAVALVVSLVCLLTTLLVDRKAVAPNAFGWVGRAGAIAWGATALQLVPLPASWTAAGQAARAMARLLEQTPPDWWPYSHSPFSTATALAKISVLVCVFQLARRARVYGDRTIVYVVCAAVALLWTVTLLHYTLGSEHYFGIWPFPLFSAFPSPLLNANHLSGLSMLGACLACGLVASTRHLWARVVLTLMAAGLVALGLLCVSRSGLLSLAVSAVVALALLLGKLWRSKLQSGNAQKRSVAEDSVVERIGDGIVANISGVAVFFTLAVLLSLSVYAGTDALAAKIFAHDYRKVDVAARAFALAFDHPFFGVGRGAFSELFVHIAGTETRFEYPENVLAQWSSEWGFPVAIAILFFLVRAFASAASRVVSGRAGALLGSVVAALLGLFAHDLFDFASESLGVAAAATALFALLEREPDTSSAAQASTWMPGRWSIWVTPRSASHLLFWAASFALLGLMFPRSGFRTSRTHYESLDGELQRRNLTAFARDFSEVALQYPSEPAFFVLRAKYAVLTNDVRAGKWLTLSMQHAPHWPAPHLLAATWLARNQRLAQAWVELRVADEKLAGASQEIACILLRRWGGDFDRDHDAELLDRVVATFEDLPDAIDRTLVSCTRAPEALRVALDTRLSAQQFLPAEMRMLERSLLRPEGRVAALERLRQIEIANNDDLARRRDELLVLALAENGAWREAAERLRTESPYQLRDPQLPVALRIFAHVRDDARASACAEEMLGRCQGAVECVAEVHRRLGDVAYETGARGRAFAEYDESNRVLPNEPSLRKVIELATELGQTTRRNHAIQALCAIVRGQEPLCETRLPAT